MTTEKNANQFKEMYADMGISIDKLGRPIPEHIKNLLFKSQL